MKTELDTKGLKIGDKCITTIPLRLNRYNSYIHKGKKADYIALPGDEFIIIDFDHDGTRQSSTMPLPQNVKETIGNLIVEIAHIDQRLSTSIAYHNFIEWFKKA